MAGCSSRPIAPSQTPTSVPSSPSPSPSPTPTPLNVTAVINNFNLKLFDKTVWFWRRVDGLIPWRGLSLIVVARKNGAATSDVSESYSSTREVSSPNAH